MTRSSFSGIQNWLFFVLLFSASTAELKKPPRLFLGDVVSETFRAYPRSSCGNKICFDTSIKYPMARITGVIDRARKILKSRSTIVISRNKSIDLQTLRSKLNGHFVVPSNSSTVNAYNYVNSHGCRIHTNVTYPSEGYSRRERNFFYIVNIPGLQQAVTSRHCESPMRQVCGTNSICRQLYREQRFLVLPIHRRRFKIQDLMFTKIYVPGDCHCLPGYPINHRVSI